jgi:hypothetical protein
MEIDARRRQVTVEEGRRFGSVAKLTILDFEETDAGERVEEPRQTNRLDFERGPQGVSSHRHGTEPGEDAKVQPGTKRQGGGTAAISLSIRSEPAMALLLPPTRIAKAVHRRLDEDAAESIPDHSSGFVSTIESYERRRLDAPHR